MVFKKSFFRIGMWNSRPPPSWKTTILNFHFDYLNTALSLGHTPIKALPQNTRLLCLDFSTQHEAVNTKHLILINWLYLFCGLPSRGVEHISLTQHQVPTPRRVHWCIMLLRGFEKDLKPYNNGTLRIMTRCIVVPT